jgi:membrane protein implicated in regulation of membrane protease activity
MESQDLLVIILSVTLAIFLILSIVAVSLVIKILNSVRKVSDSAESIIESMTEGVDTLASTMKRNSTAAFIAGTILHFVGNDKKKKRKK